MTDGLEAECVCRIGGRVPLGRSEQCARKEIARIRSPAPRRARRFAASPPRPPVPKCQCLVMRRLRLALAQPLTQISRTHTSAPDPDTNTRFCVQQRGSRRPRLPCASPFAVTVLAPLIHGRGHCMCRAPVVVVLPSPAPSTPIFHTLPILPLALSPRRLSRRPLCLPSSLSHKIFDYASKCHALGPHDPSHNRVSLTASTPPLPFHLRLSHITNIIHQSTNEAI